MRVIAAATYVEIVHSLILGVCTILAALITTFGRKTHKKLDKINETLNGGFSDNAQKDNGKEGDSAGDSEGE